MRFSKQVVIGLLAVVFVCGSIGLVQPPPSQAEVEFGGIKKILKKIFPPCGPGTRDQRFVVKGDKVCDNKTGLWWEQSPSGSLFIWDDAKLHCENLTTGGKTWRLPTLEEMQWDSLIDYSVSIQSVALNAGPFDNVQPSGYWPATELAGSPANLAWVVFFSSGFVSNGSKVVNFGRAWCVSGGQDVH